MVLVTNNNNSSFFIFFYFPFFTTKALWKKHQKGDLQSVGRPEDQRLEFLSVRVYQSKRTKHAAYYLTTSLLHADNTGKTMQKAYKGRKPGLKHI